MYNRRNPYTNPPLDPRLPAMMTLGNLAPGLTTAQSAGAHLGATKGSVTNDVKDTAEMLVKGAIVVGGAVLLFQAFSIWQTYAERKNIRIAQGLER